MRRVYLAAVALVVALFVRGDGSSPAATFAIRGHGWGHGLGLAQYGAYGYARDDGRNFQWIIDHYYPGTTLGAAGVGRVKVLLTEGVGQVGIAIDSRATRSRMRTGTRTTSAERTCCGRT